MQQQPDLDAILKKYGGTVAGTTPAPIRAGADLDAILKKYGGTVEGSAPSSPHDALIDKYATEFGVPQDLVRSVIAQESGGKRKAVSGKGAQGLMQLMPGTAAEMGVTDPFDPEQNIKAGVGYLKKMLDRFGGDEDKALAAYNAGPGPVEKHGGIPPYPETQAYVPAVQSGRGAFRRADPASTPGQPAPISQSFSAQPAGTVATPQKPPQFDTAPADPLYAPVDVVKPVREGIQQIQRGAAAMAPPLNPMAAGQQLVAADTPPEYVVGPVTEAVRQRPTLPRSEVVKGGASDVMEGFMRAGSPLLIPAAMASLGWTAATVMVATGASEMAQEFVKRNGGTEADQRLAGNIAAVTAAGIGAKKVLAATGVAEGPAWKIGTSIGEFVKRREAGKPKKLPEQAPIEASFVREPPATETAPLIRERQMLDAPAGEAYIRPEVPLPPRAVEPPPVEPVAPPSEPAVLPQPEALPAEIVVPRPAERAIPTTVAEGQWPPTPQPEPVTPVEVAPPPPPPPAAVPPPVAAPPVPPAVEPPTAPSGAEVAKAKFEERALTRRQKTLAASKKEAAEATADLIPMDPAQERREMARLLVEMNTGDFTPTSYTNIGLDETFDQMQVLATDLAKRKGQRLQGTGNATKLRVSGSAGAPIYDDILAHMPGSSRPTRAGVIAALQAWLNSGKVTNATLGALHVARVRAGLSLPRGGHKMTAPMPFELAEADPLREEREIQTERDAIQAEPPDEDISFDPAEFEPDKPYPFPEKREAQPDLPGAEGVRSVENKTPEFELPYALTPNKQGLGKKVEAPDLLEAKPSKAERERDAFNARGLARWFGKSKVADDEGKPLVVYHGTADDIERFDLDHPNRKDVGWLGTGVYLTTNRDLAASYTLLKKGQAGPNIMPLYAKVENPYYATQQDKERIMLIAHRDAAAGRKAADEWTRELRAKGHDGVILRYTKEQVGEKNISDEIVVFDPAGVKSAIGNAGTFDPNTDDIRRAP